MFIFSYYNNQTFKLNLALILSLVFLILVSIVYDLPNSDDVLQWQLAHSQTHSSLLRILIFEIRIPRILLAVMAGSGLAIVGNAMQGIFHNPLASPDLLGNASAATLSSVMLLYFTNASILSLLIGGVISSILSFLLIYYLAMRYQFTVLILAGVAINALLASMIAIVLSNAKNPWALSELYLWLQGSLANAQMSSLLFSGLFFLIGLVLIISQKKLIRALSLGDETAQTLGINVKKGLVLTILGVSFIIGSVIPQTGVIGFVGLVAPHLARLCLKKTPADLYLTSALFGALVVLSADSLCLYVNAFNMIYIGTLTSIIGAPFLVFILLREVKPCK